MSTTAPIILSIESSCDDTSAAVLRGKQLLSNVTANQAVHKAYGGVVPELASRAHQQHIIPVVDQAIKEANINKDAIDAVAFTRGPGLLGSLLVGTSFAKNFAMAKNIPLIEVNHMKGHILAHFIEDEHQLNKPQFPFLCLTVSGGHTQIVKVSNSNSFEVIGQSIDDAAGEAFDKIAKIMGLPYPGGPLIDKYSIEGNPKKFTFTHPKVEGFNYSFSGLKTGVLYFLQKEVKKNPAFIEENLADLCASIQHTIVSILLKTYSKAANANGIKQLAIAGGVSANSGLRNALNELADKHQYEVFIPPFAYCTDNAAMIGIAAYFKFLESNFVPYSISPKARLRVDSIE
jgi:N6-L-threonylcarbamoyladenine synthase